MPLAGKRFKFYFILNFLLMDRLVLAAGGLVLIVLVVAGVLFFFNRGGSPVSSVSQQGSQSSASQQAVQTGVQNNSRSLNSSSSSVLNNSNASGISGNSTSSSPTLLSDTEKVVSAVQGAVTVFASPSLPPGGVVQFEPFNVSFQSHQSEQTDFQTVDSLKSYNPYDPSAGGSYNLFYNSLYVVVFPSIPGGEVQQTYVEVKNVNGFLVSYEVQNQNSPAESYLVSLVCYSDPSLGAKYVVQAQFGRLNYYNTTSSSWSTAGFDDFVNDITSACSRV